MAVMQVYGVLSPNQSRHPPQSKPEYLSLGKHTQKLFVQLAISVISRQVKHIAHHVRPTSKATWFSSSFMRVVTTQPYQDEKATM